MATVPAWKQLNADGGGGSPKRGPSLIVHVAGRLMAIVHNIRFIGSNDEVTLKGKDEKGREVSVRIDAVELIKAYEVWKHSTTK